MGIASVGKKEFDCLPGFFCAVFFLVCYLEERDFSYYKKNAHTDTFLIRCICVYTRVYTWEYGCGTVSGESGELLQKTDHSWHLPCLRQGLLLFATSHTTMFVTLASRSSPASDSHIATEVLEIIQKLPPTLLGNQSYRHACTAMICQQSHLTILRFLVVFIFFLELIEMKLNIFLKNH